MKVLIIGYGSIGKRHYEVLSAFEETESIDIVTKQSLEGKNTFYDLTDVAELEKYDYYIIASETHKHYKQLSYLEQHLSSKTIFCEKPLFEREKPLNIKNNTVHVGYVLRFHPLMLKLKELLKNETILSAQTSCGQYLPTWRPSVDYRKSYSAQKQKGGGVLLDLSHEIDYVQWLCGNIKEVKGYKKKISDLEIDSDDFTTMIGVTKNSTIVNITIDYISKITHRTLHINTLENSYKLDFIASTLTQSDKNSLEQVHSISNLQKNYFFATMHRSILANENICCDYAQAQDVMRVIQTIGDEQ